MSDCRHSGSASKQGILSKEELENLMGDALFEDEIDIAFLEELHEIYDKRYDVPPVDVDASWETFRRDYMGQNETHQTENADNNTQTENTRKIAQPRKKKRMLRYSSIAALIAVLVLLGTTQVGASILGLISNWTNDIFWFGSQSTKNQMNADLESLHKTLLDYGIEIELAPTWLPERFSLSSINVFPSPSKTVINAAFEDEHTELIIQIVILASSSEYAFEKDRNELEIYRVNGIEHNIMTNNGKVNIIWNTGNYDAVISGDISADEAKQMIDSIYER